MREEQKNTKFIEYDDIEYKVVEDLIVKEKDKRKVLIWLNIFMFIVLFAVIVAGIFTILLIHDGIELEFRFVAVLPITAAFVVYIFVHEFIHGLAFWIAGRVPWKNISYGVVIKSGMAYCISDVPVSLRASRISLLAPFIIVCVPLIACSVIFGNLALLITGALFISGSVGDFWYLWLLRGKPKELYMIEAKPADGFYQLGCCLVKPSVE